MTDEEKIAVIEQIGQLVSQLGWTILIPDNGDDKVSGIVIGNDMFLNDYVIASGDEDAEILEMTGKKEFH